MKTYQGNVTQIISLETFECGMRENKMVNINVGSQCLIFYLIFYSKK